MKSEQRVRFAAELNTSSIFTQKPLTDLILQKFKAYYKIVKKWNEHIPLTTITEPADFAQKHILEALFAETYIHDSIHEIWDIGTGLGVPGIPMAIIRPDSQFFLVEANKKKSIFLKEVVHSLKLTNSKVLNARFETLPEFSKDSCITSRALDDLKHLLPKILENNCRQTLLLGTSELLAKTEKLIDLSARQIESHKIPQTIDRLIISISSCT
jgi:16S rRNA (guanine527-N7)-methyltransferase